MLELAKADKRTRVSVFISLSKRSYMKICTSGQAAGLPTSFLQLFSFWERKKSYFRKKFCKVLSIVKQKFIKVNAMPVFMFGLDKFCFWEYNKNG